MLDWGIEVSTTTIFFNTIETLVQQIINLSSSADEECEHFEEEIVTENNNLRVNRKNWPIVFDDYLWNVYNDTLEG